MEEDKKEEFLEDERVGVYEIGYLILPTLNEEEVPAQSDKIKDSILKLKGTFISEGFPSIRQLAYEMSKKIDGKNFSFNKGYFGWIKFEMEASKVLEFKKIVESYQNVLRFLIVKTVRENTMFTPKIPTFKKEHKDESQVIPEKSDISEEEIDKSIDDLIIEN